MPDSSNSSYANLEAFSTRHLELDLSIDFDTRRLSGTVALDLDRRAPDARELILDTRDLDIQRTEVATRDGWAETEFVLGPPDPAFGQALRILVPADADRVRVAYATSPDASGLQWLTPSQTTGDQPFLFSQAQAIHARSFVPLQDTPAVRVTYTATLRTQPGLVAVMAAEASEQDPETGRFRYRMPQPIPSYLIAIAVGDLTFRPLGERTGVWAEPAVIDAAADEFADTEQMIATTEQLYGPYRWDRFDLLVLPPSFPFGGMENPRLTFATPTIITGDRSLVSLVAHELAHSWSGNLVTNATWEDFWLNEGFTTYIERRILEAIYGSARADMERLIGLNTLAEARRTLDVPGDRTLMPDLVGRDPDDAFSSVPYEQGALVLAFLEARFGREAFDRFLRQWFDEHAFQSVTTDQFLAFLKTQLLDTAPERVQEAELQAWLHAEDVPPFAVLPTSDALIAVDAVRDRWLGGGTLDGVAEASRDWSTQEWLHFLDSLRTGEGPLPLTRADLERLDARFSLTDSANAEIAHVWYRLAIAHGYAPAYLAMEAYMRRIGRRKLVVPLYRDLAATPEGRTLAQRIYTAARSGYHPVTQGTLDRLLAK